MNEESAEKPQRVWSELDVQQGSIDAVADTINSLTSRLNPVMLDEEPKEERTTSDKPPASTMAVRVIDHTSQIDAINIRLRDIVDRLEI